MAIATLVAVSLIDLFTGISFLAVAAAIAKRPKSRAFVTWWACLGAYLVMTGLLAFVAATWGPVFALFLQARAIGIVLLCAGTWGLVTHLAFLLVGRNLQRPLGVAYVLIGALFFVASFVPYPTAVHISPWTAELEGTGEGPLYQIVYALIGVPVILSGIAYLWLWPTTRDPTIRYRIALTGGSILAYVGSGLVSRLTQGDLSHFVTLTLFGLVASMAALLAYYPPPMVRAALERAGERGQRDAYARDAPDRTAALA